MSRRLRNLLALLIVVVCVMATVLLFDWREVAASLRHTRTGILVGGGFTILAASLLIRGLRWLVVAGTSVTPTTLRLSLLANGAAGGLAIVTPFQLGEAIKIRLAPGQASSSWRLDTSAFLVERTLDLSALCSIGLYGLALQLGHAWLAPAALLIPVVAGAVLWALSSRIGSLPAGVHPYLEAFRHRRRVLLAATLTVPLWLLNTAMWWVAAKSMSIDLQLGEVTILISGVMLAIIASMSPSGLGVSELGTRGIMLWLGHPVQDAEITAIALRLLTPLIVVAGAICFLLLLRLRRSQADQAAE